MLSKKQQSRRVNDTALEAAALKLADVSVFYQSKSEEIHNFNLAFGKCSDKAEARNIVKNTLDSQAVVQAIAKEIIDAVEEGTLQVAHQQHLLSFMDTLKAEIKDKTATELVDCIHKLVPLAAPCLDAEDSKADIVDISKDELADLGKKVADLRRVCDLALARKSDGWAKPLLAAIDSKCLVLQAYCQKHYGKKASVSEAALKVACGDLNVFMDSMQGGQWCKNLPAKAEYMTIHERAQSTIMILDVDHLRAKMQKLNEHISADKVAKKLAGAVVTDKAYEKEEMLFKEATVLEVSIELFSILGPSEARPIGLRGSVVACCKKLRINGLKDKQALPEGLYREVYDLLTKAKSGLAAS